MAQNPATKVRTQHTRIGSSLVPNVVTFNDRGQYDYVNNAAIITPELNFCGRFASNWSIVTSPLAVTSRQSVASSAAFATNTPYAFYGFSSGANSTGPIVFNPYSSVIGANVSLTNIQISLRFKFQVFNATAVLFTFGNTSNRGFACYMASTGILTHLDSGVGTAAISGTLSINTWYTLQCYTVGSTIQYRLNGVERFSPARAKQWNNLIASDQFSYMGNYAVVGQNVTGWISDLVIVKDQNTAAPTVGWNGTAQVNAPWLSVGFI